MAPLPPPTTPRIILYHQTHHTPTGTPISLLPLLTTPDTAPTHLILAAVHLNSPTNLTLNDHPPSHPRNATLWAELSLLQASGVKVLAMLGGAAKGSFTRLDGDDEGSFEAHYAPLAALLRERNFDGVDLDVEEPMTLAGVIRLIDRLKKDFGTGFLVTLAPVAAALMTSDPRGNLSGFDYEALEVMRGGSIAWYNAQFYCGWGDASGLEGYQAIVARGFDPRKVVVGLVTTPENGAGFVPFAVLDGVFARFWGMFGSGWGGVMGWELFNSEPGGRERPWEWAGWMNRHVRRVGVGGRGDGIKVGANGVAAGGEVREIGGSKKVSASGDKATTAKKTADLVLVDGEAGEEAALPEGFEYYSDGSTEE